MFLIIPLKVPPRFDIMKPLSKWLDDGTQQVSYHDDDNITNPLKLVVIKPEFTSKQCRKELLRLSAIRNCLSDNLLGSHKSAIDDGNALLDCYEYHATLLEFEKKGFPSTTHIQDDYMGLNLCWKNAFSKSTEIHHTLVWDRACTLWNIASLHSFLIFEETLQTKDSCKNAISSSQVGSCVLNVLKVLSETEDFSTVDMSKSMITYWMKILLAYGQYCIYKLANLNDTNIKQHTTLAYLIKATSNLYNDALKETQDPRLQSDVPKQSKEWGIYCKVQSMVCNIKANFHLAINHRINKQYGYEIAYLKKCKEYIIECTNFCKTTAANYGNNTLPTTDIDNLSKLIFDRLSKVMNDNNTIFKEDIPTQLDDIPSKQLIKTDLPLPNEMLQPKMKLFVGL